MEETEEEEHKITLDANNVTMDILFWSPVTTNTQGENANAVLTIKRLNSLGALAETLKILTINNSAY